MDTAQFAAFLLANIVITITLWFWNRAESREDHRQTDQKLEQMKMQSEEFRNQTFQMINAIHLEIKDFHGRLCAIEERNKRK